MKELEIRIIETIVLLITFLVVRYFTHKSINYHSHSKRFTDQRKELVKKILNWLLYTLATILVTSIWGIDQKELAFFISSLLTVIGVAFVAQWSVLSNITTGVIMFFNSTLKINESVTILDKDFEISGKVLNIGMFATQILTENYGMVSIPNNLLMQKMISHNSEEENL